MIKKKIEAKVDKFGLERVNILGVWVESTNMGRVLELIAFSVQRLAFSDPKFRPFFVVTVNPELAMTAQEDEEFRQILNGADLAIPDGNGLRLAGINEVMPGRKLVRNIVENKKYKVFYLGGRGGVAKEMAEKYGGEYDPGSPDIKSQIQNPKSQTNSNNQILNKVNRFKPDILLVAYGAPWQEKWLSANSYRLKAKVIMGVGGTFDYLTGRTKLPPAWVESARLEWLWRLIREPWRWRRQVNLVRFVWEVTRRRF